MNTHTFPPTARLGARRARRFAVIAATSLIVGLGFGAVPASASVSVSVSKPASLLDGEKVTVTLTGVPAGQGVYVRQCYQASRGQRDTTGLKCNGSIQQTDLMAWATMDGARGSQPATAPITLTLRRTFAKDGTTYSCGATDCAIFVYRDHRGLFDTSLDTVVPLRFLLPQTVKFRDVGLPKAGATLEAGSTLALAASDLRTVEGRRLTVRAVKGAGARACSVTPSSSGVRVRALRAGQCTLSLTARATATYDALAITVVYRVGR